MADASPRESLTALTRLTDVSRALTYAASLDEVLDITAECALDLLSARRVVLMLQEDDDGLLRMRAARGIPADVVDRFREPLDETLITRLEAVLGPGAREGFLGVPLVVRGAVIGLLAVLREPGSPLDERDEWLLSALADQASVALDHARRGDAPPADPPHRAAEPESAEFRRSDALRMITHDLRSPLSALHGYLHLLESGLYGPLTEPQAAAVTRLQSVSRHLQGLVSDVMEAGRLAAGTLSLECGLVAVREVATEAVAMVELDARGRGVGVAVDAPAHLRAWGEGDRLRQVLVHLLENAVRYAPEGTDVLLTAEEEGDDEAGVVRLRVVDRGPGIPEDQAELIFQPYHRGGPSNRGGGLGLGLAIARALVELMEGTIQVDRAESSGAAFLLRLKRA